MTGILLRLAGPLQSWGERSAFGVRDTAPFPTRSALTGMFAAAEGRSRDQAPDAYADLGFTVRIDRPGLRMVDFHTIGGGLPPNLTAATSAGGHKKTAVLSYRHYLADAVFTVAVTGPPECLERITEALRRPHWAPYLGRRSCPPDEPLVLRGPHHDPLTELTTRAPLSVPPPADPGRATVPVEFLWDTAPAHLPEDAPVLDVTDMPESFAPADRRYRTRRLYRTVEQLPARLCIEPCDLARTLIDYALEVPA
ncbi:type I-E CRISPR-associated protein Cas5/CasD [Streptacidiphilus sp. ASG 303]|uniref:type I-E CRISPR-associated protein Cas5/CasD n=1 Tax=Streptacidiphilus sp. ASG 303 TaxID=2896847 RepID=UPI001E4AA9D3|nr:type I-E CRISPR-associated protein Cas5/CasD [Streptacidiphilus sp. ASG 303]MCD0485204.1 type I-E CRISPR-associated protein Cas5/CasD [Streptacidiphilus sp. ASG 303]